MGITDRECPNCGRTVTEENYNEKRGKCLFCEG